MYKFNNTFRWTFLAQPDIEVVTITLPHKDIDSNIEQLEQSSKTVAQLPNSCEIDVNKNLTKTSSEQQLEYLLSNLMKYGVLIASAVVLLGGILYLIHHGAEPAGYHFFRGEPSEFRSPAGVVKAVLSGSDSAIIQLGLLLLIATPVVRVFISLLTFLFQREFIYMIVTLLVMTSLIYSLVGAYY
ncbi:hypothetical protein NIES4072_45890 [Nostoc commune NIES-4072]|uniref:DUF1634 domain-containing protein n=1 Tax=Nostoc commune NIES-4072 TaxID=2005467 RepID=A0A2R5FQ74_NOSCO|nr:DUF1634 domain-containing protein [Nostoc commune]BBD68099.1 hypothetical protein NIES4070_44940 [Nostoc commune HK-02]GBG20907.1 hypothetical protein NIES4072_45890 [Nostoc commune NIES-4072]